MFVVFCGLVCACVLCLCWVLMSGVFVVCFEGVCCACVCVCFVCLCVHVCLCCGFMWVRVWSECVWCVCVCVCVCLCVCVYLFGLEFV